MSAKGEYFINDLQGKAKKLGILKSNESLITPDHYYEFWDNKDIPKSSTILIEDSDTGDSCGELSYNGLASYDDGDCEYNIISITRNGMTKNVNCDENVRPIDWLVYLQPILDDFLDGEETLTKDDSDYLFSILQAKVDYHYRLINKDEYEEILYNTEK